MTYRTPADVRDEFRSHPRRALVLTTVVHESKAVRAHLTDPEPLIGEKGTFYEYGRFSDPAGDWLVVHALTPAGNSDAALVSTRAFQEFGSFNAMLFVGVAGSLKEDIPIGSVVIGDYVYNGHSAKVGDTEILGRPHALVPARELLVAAQYLIYSEEWRDLIRAPVGAELPSKAEYPCDFPPLAVIKGIVSGEEVVSGDKSPRFALLRTHFNDCGAVEMEGWGVMNAAHHENAPAIIVRGISDMCAGKDHEKDKLHQPIAAAHAAAFAFGILSFRSKVPSANNPVLTVEVEAPGAMQEATVKEPEERRVEVVFNFEGSKEEWSTEKIEAVVQRLRRAVDDDSMNLVRIDVGSVRLVMSVRERDLASMDLARLREAASENGVNLLGATPLDMVAGAEKARAELASASIDLLAWEKALPNGHWIERPERSTIETRFQLDTSSTVLLGEPGSGKSALLSKIASDLMDRGATIFAIKADFLSTEIRTEADLQSALQLSALPSDLVLRLSALQPVYVFIDQLDALASQLDLRSERLNVLLNLVRRIGNAPNVHILLSARTFEFNHDVRLRAINAEAVNLALPPWHEVQERLADIGINPDFWPEKARDVVRIPQALKTFIALVTSGRTEPFGTYQAMLEQLWHDRIASADDSDRLISLVSDLATQMAEEEALWLAAARFDDRLSSLKRLEALGFVVRSDSGFSVAFSHQTIFDYVLARTFVRNAGLLSTYVLERQDSLFVRAKVWSSLNYLRQAEVQSYEREFRRIWRTEDLRRHLRLLLIEFLGQVGEPLEFEIVCMSEVLQSADLRLVGLKAIGSSSGWFPLFASTAIRDAMLGGQQEANQACRLLTLNWKEHADRVTRLIEERWLPTPENDLLSWNAIGDCSRWTVEVERIAAAVLKRTPISVWHVGHVAMTLAVDQPDVALRLIRSKLDFLLAQAIDQPEAPAFPANGNEDEQVGWHIQHDPKKRFERLLEDTEWSDLPSIAEAAPAKFLEHLGSWYISVFFRILDGREPNNAEYLYPGRYVLDIELTPPEGRLVSSEKPVMLALQVAVEESAEKFPADFVRWATESSDIEILAIQQLIARGFEVAADHFASMALEWLLRDVRRFQLGTGRGHRATTIDLVQASAAYWSDEEVATFERAISAYRPQVPGHLGEPEQRRLFADVVRATKKDLLQAVGIERLSSGLRELVLTEQRALGDRFDRSYSIGEGGFIGSPMDAESMAKAKDRDILKIFREIPDDTNWDHPTHWMRGGNIQLSRAFAEFAGRDPERAIRLMDQFAPLQQERAAGYALDAMAENGLNDQHVVELFLDLRDRGFQTEEFRDSASRAIEKIGRRKGDVSDEVIEVLIQWLRLYSTIDDEIEEKETELKADLKDEARQEGSILWGYGNTSFLPSGSFNILSALGEVLLSKKEPGRDKYISILDDHLKREDNPKIWKAMLNRLSNVGATTPQIASAFLRKLFDRFPEILSTREGVVFLAHAQRWDDQVVYDLIRDWRASDQLFLQQAYGELVGLIASVKGSSIWIEARHEIIASGTDRMRAGLTYAAVNTWSADNLREDANEILLALLESANKELVAVVMDVFRVSDELVPDVSTGSLLKALADDSIDLSAAPASFVVERLQVLLPHEAEHVAKIAWKLVSAWREELGDMRTGTAAAAPQLTDLALTLHRLGGSSRQAGVAIFEAMIEIDAYGARDTLAEIDGRFGPQQISARQRVARRQRHRGRRRVTQ